MTADGKHALATGLQQADLSATSIEAIMAMHDTLTAPLLHLLEDLHIPDAATQAALVQGLINAGMQLVGHGASTRTVTDVITSILDRGVHGED